jgi:hypothetical protein
MSEDKTKQDEPVEEQNQDQEPDVEAHRYKARSVEPNEEGGDDEGMRGRRIGGR